jgi:hypothetical protein
MTISIKRSMRFEGRRARYCAATVFALLSTGSSAVEAATATISAVYRPQPGNPGMNEFVNTTPPSGYCNIWPGSCASLGLFSINLPINFSSSRAIAANHANTRDGAMISVPSGWRRLSVTHTETGQSEDVLVRVSGIGATYVVDDVRDLTAVSELVAAHGALWGSRWAEAPSPCRSSGVSSFSSTTHGFFWFAPDGGGVCAKQAKYRVPTMAYRLPSFAYQMQTPNPMKMPSGRYTGTLSYNVGPGRDFDFGDVMLPDDSSLTLNFDLTVDHSLQVEIPPGGNEVALEPQGGWQAWLHQGRKPTRLFRDQTFHLSSSARFKMRLECEMTSANTCLLRSTDDGHVVPMVISVSMPWGVTNAAGQPVIRQRLYRDGSGTELLLSTHYLDRKPGTLHFEIAQNVVAEMLEDDRKFYRGTVAVIWDAEV